MAFAQYALGPPIPQNRGEQVLIPREMLEALLNNYEHDNDNNVVYHHGVGDAMMFNDPFMQTDETLHVPEAFHNYFPEYTLEVDFGRRKRNAFGECPYYNQDSARIINRRMRDINAFGKKRKRKAKKKRRGVYKESRYEN